MASPESHPILMPPQVGASAANDLLPPSPFAAMPPSAPSTYSPPHSPPGPAGVSPVPQGMISGSPSSVNSHLGVAPSLTGISLGANAHSPMPRTWTPPPGSNNGDGRSVDTRTQLFVGNLPYRVRWQDLKDLMRKCGTVLRADVSLVDGRSRGFGTVLFANQSDAHKAIEVYNGYVWQSRSLDVRLDLQDPHGAIMATMSKMQAQQQQNSPFPFPFQPPPMPMPPQNWMGPMGPMAMPVPMHMAPPMLNRGSGMSLGHSTGSPMSVAGSPPSSLHNMASSPPSSMQSVSVPSPSQSVASPAKTEKALENSPPPVTASLLSASTSTATSARPSTPLASTVAPPVVSVDSPAEKAVEAVVSNTLPPHIPPPPMPPPPPPPMMYSMMMPPQPGSSPYPMMYGGPPPPPPPMPGGLAHYYQNQRQNTPIPSSTYHRNLFVGNLPFNCQWQELKDLMRSAGNVLRADVELGQDGRSRGWGRVVMANYDDAQKAVTLFNGFDFNGRVLKVHFDRFSGGPSSQQGSPGMFPMQMPSPMSMGGGPPPMPHMNTISHLSAYSQMHQQQRDQLHPQQQQYQGMNGGGHSPVELPLSAMSQHGSRRGSAVTLNGDSGSRPSTGYGPGSHPSSHRAPSPAGQGHSDGNGNGGARSQEPHYTHAHHPDRIAMPPPVPFPFDGPMSPNNTRGLPPMTPSMPAFTLGAFPQTPPQFPAPFFSPGLGPFSPPLGSSQHFVPPSHFMNAAPGAPVHRRGNSQLGSFHSFGASMNPIMPSYGGERQYEAAPPGWGEAPDSAGSGSAPTNVGHASPAIDSYFPSVVPTTSESASSHRSEDPEERRTPTASSKASSSVGVSAPSSVSSTPAPAESASATDMDTRLAQLQLNAATGPPSSSAVSDENSPVLGGSVNSTPPVPGAASPFGGAGSNLKAGWGGPLGHLNPSAADNPARRRSFFDSVAPGPSNAGNASEIRKRFEGNTEQAQGLAVKGLLAGEARRASFDHATDGRGRPKFGASIWATDD